MQKRVTIALRSIVKFANLHPIAWQLGPLLAELRTKLRRE
jgi:hypothetical protein